ncbi:Uncharacterised protein [Chlamydia trachomatis]|nr:Uncharacterised protein [Chlamydia trachomatis]
MGSKSAENIGVRNSVEEHCGCGNPVGDVGQELHLGVVDQSHSVCDRSDSDDKRDCTDTENNATHVQRVRVPCTHLPRRPTHLRELREYSPRRTLIA